MTIDRHKVLQILFNLLENAKYACDERGAAEKQVTVRIQPAGDGRVQVRVADNGVGIPAENLHRIFGQEFSTKKGGHGFGLHSSILTAQDMGGSLSAQSDGSGKGAVFILEIPLNASTPHPGPAEPEPAVVHN
jgi:signal transduction histidine kinase